MFSTILVSLFLVLGLIINCLSVVSLYRFPDVYTRMHGATKCSTLGSFFVALAVIIYAIAKGLETGESRFWVLIIHVVFVIFALFITNPTGAHVLARAAYHAGVLPKNAVVDEMAPYYARNKEEEEDGI